MKKISLLFKLMLVLSIIIYSCQKEYSPADAVNDQIKLSGNALKDSLTRDSLRRLGGVIHYSINIVDGSDAGFSDLGGMFSTLKSAKSVKKIAAITGAKVIAVQYGKTFVATDTAGNGIVTIKDLRIGTVSVRIQANGFTECSFIARLDPDSIGYNTSSSDMWNLERYAGTMVPLFPTTGSKMATISGVVTYQTNLIDSAREKAAGVDVFGVIDVNNSDFIEKYMASFENSVIFNTGKRGINSYGHIVKIAYNSIVFRGTTDATGAYTIQVPATGDGLPIRMEVSEVAANQRLLLDSLNSVKVYGPQTVRTLFSSNYTPSTIPDVPAAYCTFSAPSGTGLSNQPVTSAAATAVISESGIISITLTDPGFGYTQVPKVTITVSSGTVLTPATATATLSTDNRVADIAIGNQGVGYSGATVSITGSETTTATASGIVTYGVGSVNVITGGSGYNTATPPTVTVYSNSGTGAIATANMKGNVNQINVTNGGTGYTVAPIVVINGDGTGAAATAVLTGTSVTSVTIIAGGSGYTTPPTISFVSANGVGSGATGTAVLAYYVSSVTVTNQGSGYLPADANVVIAAPTAGVQATATVSLTTTGVLSRLLINNPGLGYTANPVVKISGGSATTDAIATATVSGGQVTGLTITNPGAGYTSNPTVTIATYQRAATATALCNSKAGQIIAVNLTNNGEGYKAIPVVEFYYPSTGGTTTGNGNGSNATARADTSGGRVTDVTITNGGSGYYSVPLVRFRMPNVNQIASAKLTISKDGYVTGIALDNNPSGWGYTSVPTVTITPSVPGKGAGASAIVTKMDNSQVTAVKIVNQGSGYLGKNNPRTAESFQMITAGGSGETTVNTIFTLTNKSYVRDIYLGTGKRTIEK